MVAYRSAHRSAISLTAALLTAAGMAGCQMQLAITPINAPAEHFADSARPEVDGAGATDQLAAAAPASMASLPHPSPNGVPRKPDAARGQQPQKQKTVRHVAGWTRTARTGRSPVSADKPQPAHGQPATLVIDDELLPPLLSPALLVESKPKHADTAKTDGMQTDGDQAVEEKSGERFPIDLPTVLRLAGADNWDVQLASERVREAQARLDAAKVLLLPSLVGGVGYNKHDGQIQDTRGDVIDVSRSSLFVGGGAGVSGAPLTGGSGGPARFFVDLSLADAIFEPLAARRLVQAEQARESATLNDTLQDASLAYYDLIGAQGLAAIARKNLDDARQLSKLTDAFVVAGKGSQADTARVRVEVSARRQETVRAEMAVKVTGAELARILQLEPNTALYALEDKPVPVELVRESSSLSDLIAQAQAFRPEIAEHQARLEASDQRVRAERWRPLIPSIYLGASSGGFGGGVGDNIQHLDGRGDFDILAVWQLKNLGFGTRALRQQRNSQYRQALIENLRIRDVVAAEVSVAYHHVRAERERLKLAGANVEQALESYRKNITRIRGLAGLPLEALQAVGALAAARQTYLTAIIDYNQAQVRLLRAIGEPITTSVVDG